MDSFIVDIKNKIDDAEKNLSRLEKEEKIYQTIINENNEKIKNSKYKHLQSMQFQDVQSDKYADIFNLKLNIQDLNVDNVGIIKTIKKEQYY